MMGILGLVLLVVATQAAAQTSTQPGGVMVRFDADPYCNWEIRDGAVKDRMVSLDLTAASTAIRDQITCSATIKLEPLPTKPPPVAQTWKCVQRGGSWCRDDVTTACMICTPPATKALTFEIEHSAQDAEEEREEARWHLEEAVEEQEYCQQYCPAPEVSP